MSAHTSLRLAAVAPAALTGILLAACGATVGGSPATSAAGRPATAGGSPSGSSTPQPASGASSGSDAKCTDLTATAATAALGKPTTVALDTGTPLPGLTVCDLTVADAFYSIQLAVDTNINAAEFSEEEQAFGGVDVSGIGDKAFTSSVGIEVLSGSVDIKVTGPAGPVLSGNYTYSTAVARAMLATL
jgi:hypothetical protein